MARDRKPKMFIGLGGVGSHALRALPSSPTGPAAREPNLPRQIFIAYSREDQPLVKRLLAHLEILKTLGLARIFCDLDIEVGEKFSSRIESAIDESSIALLMVSPEFLTSEFVNQTEVPRILARQAEGRLRVIPVLLRPCPWEAFSWLAELELHLDNGRELGMGTEQEIERGFSALALKVLDWLSELPEDDPPPTSAAVAVPEPAAEEGRAKTVLEARGRFGKRSLAYWLARYELGRRIAERAPWATTIEANLEDPPALGIDFGTSNITVSVTSSQGKTALPAAGSDRILHDRIALHLRLAELTGAPEGSAYVIYTSGWTGQTDGELHVAEVKPRGLANIDKRIGHPSELALDRELPWIWNGEPLSMRGEVPLANSIRDLFGSDRERDVDPFLWSPWLSIPGVRGLDLLSDDVLPN